MWPDDYEPVVMWPASEENLPVIEDARIGMAVTSARPMAAAIRPYSMAVAPEFVFHKAHKLGHFITPLGYSTWLKLIGA